MNGRDAKDLLRDAKDLLFGVAAILAGVLLASSAGWMLAGEVGASSAGAACVVACCRRPHRYGYGLAVVGFVAFRLIGAGVQWAAALTPWLLAFVMLLILLA